MTPALGAGCWPSLRGCASADTARAVVLQALEDEVEAELGAGLQDVLGVPFSPTHAPGDRRPARRDRDTSDAGALTERIDATSMFDDGRPLPMWRPP